MTPDVVRRGRGKAQATMDLIDACHEILREIQPASVRAVCYRLFTMGLIPNMSKSNTNRVSTQLVWAREQGLIDWNHVVDETREPERVAQWSNPDEIVNAAVKGYRRDAWQDQDVRVEVWSEKGTVRGTLAPVLGEFGVTFRVMHGYASATSLNAVAEFSNESEKPLVVLYVGDYDPSGMHMSRRDLPERLDRYGGKVELRRIALLDEDLAGLPFFLAASKQGDPRHAWFTLNYGQHCWELDAMSPVLLRERVRAEISKRINPDAWQHALTIERAQVTSMRQFHDSWTNRLGEAGAA